MPVDTKRSRYLTTRYSPSEMAKLEECAARDGVDKSVWARMAVLRAVADMLAKVKRMEGVRDETNNAD